MDAITQFKNEVQGNIQRLGEDKALAADTLAWMIQAGTSGAYTYNFQWLGRPIIQYPQDIHAMQEIIWATRPDVIVETGIAHGGSLILSASMLAMLDYCDAQINQTPLLPGKSNRRVIGVDIDIRAHNRQAIEAHPMSHLIRMVQGSSIAPDVVQQVRDLVGDAQRVLVCLDSNHTHDHVLAELEAYAPMTTPGSYCIVFDTVVEDMPPELCAHRPWGKGNSPKTAVQAWLPLNLQFEQDFGMQHKLQITVAQDGFLKRVR
ncbi:cephalosporin hydroxylase family protein [Achromobacter mucicolens]|uniref:cephalosporin hydroxylase family protein n=1 Tax=Achromobacter mucicolens TaxID=1389922 RepID=UPI0020A40C2E|nr:cephalosporin hydroxylase family protein [Achromobacter mucicolens]MCP2513935.1 cephalosporin hydroxylase family protein [Achromobacter mucicolens]